MHSPQNHALQKNNHEILIISYLELQLSQMMPPSLAQRLGEDAHKQHNESWFLPGHRQSLTSCGRTTAASRTRDTSWSPPVPVPCLSTSTMPRLAPPYRANGSVFAIKEMLLGSTHNNVLPYGLGSTPAPCQQQTNTDKNKVQRGERGKCVFMRVCVSNTCAWSTGCSTCVWELFSQGSDSTPCGLQGLSFSWNSK